MTPERQMLTGAALGALTVATGGCMTGQTAEKPNIVVIIADDMGWADPGYRGSPIRTPNMDRIGREGAELDRFYVCPVCSPTRAGVMTGRYPNRTGMHGHPSYFLDNKGLPPDEYTLAEMLRDAGYKHRHAIGKWHLGTAATCFHPINQGFTGFYGHYCGMINDCWEHTRGEELDWHRNYQSDRERGYSTRLMSSDAVRFIESVPDNEPFFLYLAYNAVHEPVQAPTEDIARYDGVDLGPYDAVYAAMTTVMDEGIGDVLDALAEKGVTDNTLVLFFSDNGGTGRPNRGNNKPLRGQKGTVYEGGVRVPAVIRWPDRIPGGRKVDAVMGHVDLLPTLAAAAGYEFKPGKPLDGINVLDVIAGREEAPDRAYYPDGDAVVTQRWKLVGDELYDLAADPCETENIADQHPEVLKEMKKHLQYFKSLTGPKYIPPGLPENKEAPPPEWKMPGKEETELCTKAPAAKSDSLHCTDDLPGDAFKTYAAYARAVKAGHEKDDGEIPRAYWAERIKALDPVRAYTHKGHVVVVQEVDAGVEKGKYIFNPRASYLPESGIDGFEYTPDPVKGDLYYLGNGVFDFEKNTDESGS